METLDPEYTRLHETFNALDAEKLKSIVEKCWGSEFDPFKLGGKIGLWCCKYSQDNLGCIQPEVVLPIMSLVLSAWSSYILEAKSICHYRQSRKSFRYFLENIYIPKIKSTIIDSRNIAIDGKREKQLKGDSGKDGDVPNYIQIPQHYTKLSRARKF